MYYIGSRLERKLRGSAPASNALQRDISLALHKVGSPLASEFVCPVTKQQQKLLLLSSSSCLVVLLQVSDLHIRIHIDRNRATRIVDIQEIAVADLIKDIKM